MDDFRSTLLTGTLLFSLSTGLTGATIADRADAIVVAESSASSQQAAQPSFTLLVDRVIKGSITPGGSVTVVLPGPTPGNQQISGIYGMWFLHASGLGVWQLIPTMGSSTGDVARAPYPLSKGGAPPAEPQSASPNELIAGELAAAVQEFRSGTQFYFAASGLLSTDVTPSVVSCYQALASSADPDVRLLGLIGLARQGDIDSLVALPATQDALRNTVLANEVYATIGNIRDRSTRAVQTLGGLATSQLSAGPIIKRAAEALRINHSRDALPFLVALLDSTDPAIRHQGLAGLSMFVENLPIQI